MASSPHITPYTPQYREQVLSLLAHLWGEDHTQNAGYFAWKHERNPYLERPCIFLAVEEERVLGMRALFATRWLDGEQTCDCLCLADTVVHPEHRGRGILQAITNHIYDTANLPPGWILTLSPSAATRHVALNRGGRDIGPLGIAKRKGSAPPTAELLRSAQGAPPIRHVEALPLEALLAVDAALPPEPRIHHERGRVYWAWRFTSPRSRYRYFLAEGDTPQGYLVQQCFTRAGRTRSRIVAWEATTSAGQAALLAALVADPQAEEVSIWQATLGADRVRLLAEAGFIGSPPENPELSTLLVNRIGPAAEPVETDRWLALANWRLSMIDSDAH